MSELETGTVTVEKLMRMGAPWNPRKMSDDEMASLRRSMKFFGVVEPIVVNLRTERIVGGHMRVKAAEAEGIETLPCVYVDIDEPSEKQLNIALNRIAGTFDDDKLEALLRDLRGLGADLDLTGFGKEEILKLFGDLDADPPGQFPDYSDGVDTDYKCPKCGYAWSGTKAPNE